jgi:NAD(P)-dependent dehydrogenase (short-subunit alcohol dehydrogenase family)/uncharacterized membrane protein YgcG
MATSTEKFLVTGAAGCIGAWAVRLLLDEGVPVLATDLSPDLRRFKLISQGRTDDKLEFGRLDVTSGPAVAAMVADRGITHVVHLAGLQLPFCAADPPLGAMVNVVGTVNVFEAVRAAGRTIGLTFASSAAVFGDPSWHRAGLVADASELLPDSFYGVHKAANEGTAKVYARQHGGQPGAYNAITDVPGVEVGYVTLIEGDSVRTGVTAIHPRGPGGTGDPVAAGFHNQNGNGEMTGVSWISESGTFDGPVAITNTHAVGTAHAGIVAWTVRRHPVVAEAWLLPVAAETWDGYLNDINAQHVTEHHVVAAIEAAAPGPVRAAVRARHRVRFPARAGPGRALCRRDRSRLVHHPPRPGPPQVAHHRRVPVVGRRDSDHRGRDHQRPRARANSAGAGRADPDRRGRADADAHRRRHGDGRPGRGFRQYLMTVAAAQAHPAGPPGTVYDYLPYAIAFDCTGQWTDLTDKLARTSQAPSWYQASESRPPMPAMHHFATVANDRVASAGWESDSSGSAFSGGSSFSGGFSGGGGGGGGGGSW